MKTINFEKKKMIPLTNEQQELYDKRQKSATFAKKVCTSILTIKTIGKLRTIAIILLNPEVLQVCSLKYVIPYIPYIPYNLLYLKIPVTFQNGSDYDYHFFHKRTSKII